MSVVSHAGHSPGVHKQPPSQDDQGGTRDWFSLEDQISHKLAFLQERAERKRTLYLVGHSIGCYMILKMLKHLAPSQVRKIFFLFPTIEKMAATPNGVSSVHCSPHINLLSLQLFGSWEPSQNLSNSEF